MLHRCEETSRVFKGRVSPYLEGDIFYNKDLSNTFKSSVENSSKAFYEGDIADKIAEFMKQDG
ncbi:MULTISPECIES: gamma-glutamyltransferase [Staphylococcus]|uniref:gamma-glutamyltransferase n=1 Tax=Staphylococcus TaxID=1279 RepID=UPI0012DAF91C